MKLVANENFPGDAVEALWGSGHDVLWVRTAFPGASDARVLERATVEQRVLRTFDKDFGELAFRWGLSATSRIIAVPNAIDLARAHLPRRAGSGEIRGRKTNLARIRFPTARNPNRDQRKISNASQDLGAGGSR